MSDESNTLRVSREGPSAGDWASKDEARERAQNVAILASLGVAPTWGAKLPLNINFSSSRITPSRRIAARAAGGCFLYATGRLKCSNLFQENLSVTTYVQHY